MAKATRDRVFLSYAHEDLDKVRRIYSGLKQRKLIVWFDKEDLGAGRWKPAITKAIARSRYFVICISEAALKKTGDEEPGFQDEELNTAYNIAQEQPDKEFSIVPVRLEDCDCGDFRLTGFQQYDLFENFENGLDKLAIRLRPISLSDATARDERTEDEKIIEGLKGKTETAIYANDFKGALAYLNSIIEIKPDDSKALFGKGLTLSRLGLYKDAILTWDKVLEIDPDFYQVWAQKGLALVRMNRHEEALAALEKALKAKPDSLWSWHGKGAALINLGRYEEALAAYNKALEIKPDLLESLNGKGIALITLGRYEEALETCNKALEIDPDDEDALILKRNLLKTLNQS